MTIDSYVCPTCGSEVKVGAACPGCAPKRKPRQQRARSAPRERKPWEQEETYDDGLDLPDEGFDYDDFVAREFGHKPHRQIGIKWYWWLTAAVLLIAMIAAVASGWF